MRPMRVRNSRLTILQLPDGTNVLPGCEFEWSASCEQSAVMQKYLRLELVEVLPEPPAVPRRGRPRAPAPAPAPARAKDDKADILSSISTADSVTLLSLSGQILESENVDPELLGAIESRLKELG